MPLRLGEKEVVWVGDNDYTGVSLERWPSGLRQLPAKQLVPKGAPGFESRPLRQLGNEVIGSPATRARQPFFGEISSRFEFSKAKSGVIKKPSVLLMAKIAKALGVSIEELLR